MVKRIALYICVVVFLLMNITFSYADVLTFGGDNNRQHLVTEEVFPVLQYLFSANVGTSQSQPLIIGREKTPDKKSRIYSMAGDKLWALNAEEKQEIWSKSVNGGQGVSGSHTTYFEGLLYSGTADGRIVVHDQNGNKIDGVKIGSRIVSAPLVIKWQGHTLVIAGSNDGKAYIIANLGNLKQKTGKKAIPIGGVLTSSPVPIGDKGFLIASDGAEGKVAGIYFEDLFKLQGTEIISKTNFSPRWLKEFPAGIPASFAVSIDYAYFMTKRGHLIKMNNSNGKATRNDQYAASTTFSNHSPAVDDKYVYYPVNSLNGGDGAVIILDKNTMQLIKVLNLTDKLTTAPLILQKTKSLIIGQSGGYLGIYEIGGTWQKQAVKLTEVIDMPKGLSLSGISSEISVSDNKLVVGVRGSNFSGLMVFSMLKPTDLAVEKIDLGVLAKDIKPGAIHTGHATLRNLSSITTVINNNPILTINNNKTALYDENNNKITDLKLAANEEKKLKFTWKAPNTEEVKFTSTINLPPAFWETNYINNIKTLTLSQSTLKQNNLIVKVLEYPKTSYEGELTSVKARITYASGELITTKLIWKVNGKVINKKDSINIVKARDEILSFKMPSGKATVTVEINPDHNKPVNETTWADNKDTCSIGLAVPEEKETKGKYTLSITAPNLVNANTAFNYSVRSGYTGTKKVRNGTDSNGNPKYKTVKVIKNVKLKVTADYLKTVRYQSWNDYMENKQYTDTFNNSFSVGSKTLSYKNNGAFVINNPTAVIITAKLYEGNTIVAKQSKMVNVNPLPYERYLQLSQ